MADDWRNIPAGDVCWEGVSGATRRRVAPIYWNLRPPERSFERPLSWHGKTLGEIADMGEHAWRHVRGIGDMAVDIIKVTIDAAAAGIDVTMRAHRGYTPRPFQPPTTP